MLATSPPLAQNANRIHLDARELLPTLVLALVLCSTTLAQHFYVIPNPRLFVRWGELLFVASVLLTSSASLRAPLIHPAWIRWMAIGWCVSTVFSVVQAANIGHALLRQGEWMNHILFAFSLWTFARDRSLPLKAICLAIPAGFLLVGIDTFGTWMSLPRPRSFEWFYNIPLISHVRHLGYYGLAALIFSACPLLGVGRSIGHTDRMLAFGALAACWGFLFWTGGRAAVGSGILSLAFMTWMAGKDQRLWMTMIWVAAAALGFWISSLFLTEDPKMGFLNALERTSEASTTQGVNGFTTGRLTIWGVALDAVAERPWFGLGPDGYKFIEVPHHGIQPHGLFVQILIEWGIIGAVPFLGVLAAVFWTGFKRMRLETDPLRRTVRITAYALIVGCTVHSLVDGLYYHPQPLLFLFTGFALVLLPLPQGSTPESPPVLQSPASRRTFRIFLLATLLLSGLFLMSSDWAARLLWS